MAKPQESPVPGPTIASNERDGLLFAWKDKGPVAAHLGLFAAISLAVHLFGFYLFQVVYPVTGRVEPVPSRIQLLDPAQPTVSALMRQVDDRLVFLRPASSGSDVRVDLNDSTTPFRPSFTSRRVQFLLEPGIPREPSPASPTENPSVSPPPKPLP